MNKVWKTLLAIMLVLSLCFAVASCDKKDTTVPEQPVDDGIPDPLTLEEYQALSAEERQNYFNQFTNYEDFFDWYHNAVAQYNKDHPDEEFDGDIEIDLNDYINNTQ